MFQYPSHARVASEWLLLVGTALLLLLSSIPLAMEAPGNLPSPGMLPAVTYTTSGPGSARLEEYSTAVAVGDSATFALNITADCTSGSAPIDSIAQVVFSLGDGFVFQEPGSLYGSSCGWMTGYLVVFLSYAYRLPGTYDINASVVWAGGPTMTSNSVDLTVTLSTAAVSIELWLYAGAAVSGAALGICLLLRRHLPESPSLPPGEA